MRFLFFGIFMFGISAAASVSKSWLQAQQQRSAEYLLENISRPDTPRGFVVASPSKADPNYYYHWVRDAALVMRALDKYMEPSAEKEQLFLDYIDLVLRNQRARTLTGLGEPKFNADGSGYAGPWGRPQNDGPALRAITLIHYARTLLVSGQEDLVRAKLYNLYLPAVTAIKRDLEYVSHNWEEPDFDLWEEVKGTHFYTRMVQRTALFLGAQLADDLGDPKAAQWYLSQSKLIGQKLENHWSEKRGYILSTLNRVGGLDYKRSGLDSSVILAVNHAWVPGLSFGPSDDRVIKTYGALVQAFNGIYPINNRKRSGRNLGAAIGRYPEDRYYGGNPWFLLTHAMAEYLFTLGRDNEANTYLQRSRRHMDQDSGRMAEQFSRFTGYMLGARDLTWSYASILTVVPNED